MSDPTIRRMTGPGELAAALDWAAAEGWNPGWHDAGCYWTADPRGFFLAEAGGEPVGCISNVVYDHSFAFLGLYLVRPDMRGRGVGMALWSAAMEHAGKRNVGLDGVPEQEGNYERSGFRRAYRNVRYEGLGQEGEPPPGVAELTDPALAEPYDRAAFPAARQGFLARWLGAPGHRAFLVEDRGYAVARPCRSGVKIGPLFAHDDEAAELLFTACASTAPGEPLYLDVPEPHAAAVALAERHEMAPVFACARMYTGPDPPIRLDRVYGNSTLELG